MACMHAVRNPQAMQLVDGVANGSIKQLDRSRTVEHTSRDARVQAPHGVAVGANGGTGDVRPGSGFPLHAYQLAALASVG